MLIYTPPGPVMSGFQVRITAGVGPAADPHRITVYLLTCSTLTPSVEADDET
jgi:hypothetical protein